VGIIRFLLAAAVVLGHAPGWGGLDTQLPLARPLPPYFAVQAFFVISGFYMELLRKKYAPAPIWLFYSNRYSRLIVSYWIVCGLTWILMVSMPGASFPAASFNPGGSAEGAFLAFSNVTLLGQDLIPFVSGNASAGVLIPQAWSLSLELYFYLLVPALWRASDRLLWAIAIGSLAIRLIIVFSPLPFYPWQQRFFPAEFGFFVLGMLAFRRSEEIQRVVKASPALLPLVGCSIVFVGWLEPATIWVNSMIVAAILFLTLPAIFSLTRRNEIDRLIGEFSYPIYLVHITIGYFFEPARHLWSGVLLLFLSVAVSAPLVLFIERPLERWRNNRLRTSIVPLDLHAIPSRSPSSSSGLR
jgi:peptidoglycan/LPS O-acetylase OafA/YrhL